MYPWDYGENRRLAPVSTSTQLNIVSPLHVYLAVLGLDATESGGVPKQIASRRASDPHALKITLSGRLSERS